MSDPTTETEFIEALRSLAAAPAARSLLDDAAVVEIGGASLVLTHDMICEDVHFLRGDPPGDVAWKLVAVNLSDLAAKGARPLGALLGYSLSSDGGWNREFLRGLEDALGRFELPLLGGDTVRPRSEQGRCFGLTAIGTASAPVPGRSGGRAGDLLWVTGTMGDGGAGLRIARGEIEGSAALLRRYRRPEPRLAAGEALASLVTAMMDVSDGLLIDAGRLADASGVAIAIDLEAPPLSSDYVTTCGSDRAARLKAATAGDDYELLFTASEAEAGRIHLLSDELTLSLTIIGRLEEGAGLRLSDRGGAVPLPDRLGWEHG